jgi:hypothetical protein
VQALYNEGEGALWKGDSVGIQLADRPKLLFVSRSDPRGKSSVSHFPLEQIDLIHFKTGKEAQAYLDDQIQAHTSSHLGMVIDPEISSPGFLKILSRFHYLNAGASVYFIGKNENRGLGPMELSRLAVNGAKSG